MDQIFFHIDVNSAFLSWSAKQALENGCSVDYRTIPSIIGGDIEKRHGVVLAKSIPAKKYKITTGEPIVNALRKCPNLTILSPDHELYHTQSRKLMTYLSDICPDIEQVSIDECYMNYTPIATRFSSPETGASFIKDGVRDTFGFTVNIGISDRKILAKMASDFEKPDKIHTLFHTQIKQKMWSLPVSELFMCGKSSVETLHKLGILTIGELAQADPDILSAHLKSHGITLWEYANGIDDSTIVTQAAEAKGIGNSTTLSQDVTTREAACQVLLSLADSVSSRLRASRQLAGMVSTEIKYHTFQSVSHQSTLLSPAASTQAIYHLACTLFDECWDGTPIRLLGIRTSKLVDENEPIQMSLFDLNTDVPGNKDTTVSENGAARPSNAKLLQLEHTIDSIRHKYGEQSVIRGSFLKKPSS